MKQRAHGGRLSNKQTAHVHLSAANLCVCNVRTVRSWAMAGFSMLDSLVMDGMRTSASDARLRTYCFAGTVVVRRVHLPIGG
jgi:hypothetical protein